MKPVFRMVITPRRGGKSTLIIRECLEREAILVVHNRQFADAITKVYKLPKDRLITFDQLISNDYQNPKNRPIMIDDADFLLKQLTKGNVDLCTFSMDNPDLYR